MMSQAKYKLILVFSILLVLILNINLSVAADYRNAYMIGWDGSACDNIDYAKSMGYDYVMYQSGMEKCANSNNLYFYIESPDQKLEIRRYYIYFDETYTDAEKTEYSNLLLWKSNEPFPYNLATGWFFSSNYFRPLVDFQQQKNIDLMVSRAIALAKETEDTSKNFLFGGWSWDVPNLEGDLWSGPQNLPLMNRTGTGKQINISYWTDTCSGVTHSGITHEYSCYRDGKAAYYKKLFSETKKQYPNMKVYMEPFTPWNSYMKDISSRSDLAQLKPDLLCEESSGLEFVSDSRIFGSGLMTKDKVCSDTPNVFDHQGNLVIAGNAAVNGAWFLWYGRLGGTGNFQPYNTIKDIPDRLKLIRAVTSWDNINNVPLSNRKWDANKLEYTSSLSKANMNIIYSVHPKNKKTYLVILNKAEGVNLQGKAVDTIYSVDGLFQPKASAIGDFTQKNGVLYLNSDANLGKGYILSLKAATTNTTANNSNNTTTNTTKPNTTNVTISCSDSDGGNNILTKGSTTGKSPDGKSYSYNDTCTSNTIIREYYCQSNLLKESNQTCTNGCSNGACKITNTTSNTTANTTKPNTTNTTIKTSCSDTDGNNLAIRGAVTGINSSNKTYSFTDTCASSTTVREYYCQNNANQNKIYNCTNGCVNGTCKTTASANSTNTTTTNPPSTTGGSSGGSSGKKKSSGGGGGGGSISSCGDNKCSASENCTTCSTDCGACPIVEYCGDNICNSMSENCTTCQADCGMCPIPILNSQTQNFQENAPVTATANSIAQMQNTNDATGKELENEKTNKITGLASDESDEISINNKFSTILLLIVSLAIVGVVIFLVHKKQENKTGVFPSYINTFADLLVHYPDHAQHLKLYVQKAKILGYAEHLIRQSLLDQGWPESIIEPVITGTAA